MKNLFKVLALVFAVTFIFTSCKKKITPPPINHQVEDGYYVVGNSIFADSMQLANVMIPGTIDDFPNSSKLRDGLYYKFMYVTTAGDGFVVKQQKGTETITWGLDGSFTDDTIASFAKVGNIVKNGSNFTVAEDGFYMFAIDLTTSKVHLYKISDVDLIGAFSGWSADSVMTQVSIDKGKGSWTISNITLKKDDGFKFRFNGTWNLVIADGASLQTNLGGDLTGLTQGGDNITNAANGIYTVNLNWTFAKGFTATTKKTGDYTPPAYPDSLFIVGGSTNYGWATPGTNTDAAFHKCADAGDGSNDGLFWKICYIADTSNGFKISANNWTSPNLGFADVDKFDANGVAVADNGGNMSVANAGMYMVVVDLRNSTTKVSVTTPMVYGMGDAFGGWNIDSTANLFTVDLPNQNLVSPATTANGDLRMYVSHAWIAAWWNAEFLPQNGKILYRNDGGDLPAISSTIGTTVTLHFDDNTATVQ